MSHQLGVLFSVLGLGEPRDEGSKDTILAAIDFEGSRHIEQCYQNCIDSEFGITTLDVRSLHYKSKQPLAQILQSREIVTGTHQRWLRSIKNFKLGAPERVSIYNMEDKVKECLDIKDHLTNEARPIILVKHGGTELRTLYSLRVTKNNGLQNVQVVLDTCRIAREVLNLAHNEQLGLDDLCGELGFGREGGNWKIHAAGNDANRTLRVLLLLAIRHHENLGLSCTESQAKLISSLRKIALEPLPPPKSDSEVERYIALDPVGELDDPKAPVDASFFSYRTSRKEAQQKVKKRAHDRKEAVREFKREEA